MGKIAINGFGRIGRIAARIWFLKHQHDSELVAINTSGSMDLQGWAHLLKYDSAYGQFPADIDIEVSKGKDEVSDEDPLLGHIILDKTLKIPVLAQRDPEKLPWEKYQVGLVIESTGVFRTEEEASKHIKAGAKQVLISAPGKGGHVETIVLGVQEVGNTHNIVSNASCTTNCTSPVVKAIHDALTVKKAMLTTIHAYTDDQSLQDGSHKDLRRARAAAVNMIPTSTGAAKATAQVIPDLEGKFDGIAIRVPVITGSISDITMVVDKKTTVEEVNKILEDAASGSMKGILGATREPLVSSDVIGINQSALADLGMTKVVDGDLIKIIAWYDNEWGFTNRLVETASLMSNN